MNFFYLLATAPLLFQFMGTENCFIIQFLSQFYTNVETKFDYIKNNVLFGIFNQW